MLGVFAAGGGTGAGAVLGALSLYKKNHGRYTMGVAILPNGPERLSHPLAGRFLVRYLSRDLADRPDTVLMFSNSAAYEALAAADAEVEELKKETRELVNWYLRTFLFFYTQINQPRNYPVYGKVFDTNDFKNQMGGTAFIGFASSQPTDFDPAELFASALSPMHFGNNNAIAGLAVGFDLEKGKPEEIQADLKRLISDSANSLDAVENVRSSSLFYRTLKKICVFFFITERTKDHHINKITRNIEKCCELLTGGSPTLQLAIYHIEGLPADAVMIIGSGGYLGESLMHLEAYIKEAFFPNQDQKAREAMEAIWETIERCSNPLDSETLEEEKKILAGKLSSFHAEQPEQISAQVRSNLLASPRWRQIVESKEFGPKYYVTWGQVVSTALILAEWAVIPKSRSKSRYK